MEITFTGQGFHQFTSTYIIETQVFGVHKGEGGKGVLKPFPSSKVSHIPFPNLTIKIFAPIDRAVFETYLYKFLEKILKHF